MIKVSEMIKDLKHIENRDTFYSNTYPYNCGYVHAGGRLSFDCIGLVKSYINYPKIAYKTKPNGFFVRPGLVIPDVSEVGILNLCSGKSTDFRYIKPGAYMVYQGLGHGGIYVGDYKDASGVVNTIECTCDMGGGVKSSYTDSLGYRWDHKGGQCFGRWIQYGYLTMYVDYTEEKKKEKKKSYKTIAKEVIAGKWGVYPERKRLLEKAGYNYEKVQKYVNAMLK